MGLQVAETVISFGVVVLLVVALRRWRILEAAHTPLFARLLTGVVLPAAIVSQLMRHPIAPRQVVLVLTMLCTGAGTMVLAWAAGVLLRLPRGQVGALMIASSFTSSALLGYPLIQFAFPGNTEAFSDAVLVSELGVGLPIFTLCPLVAMAFGQQGGQRGVWRRFLLDYLRSPVFLAVVVGLALAALPLHWASPALQPIATALTMVENSLTVLACLVLGLSLRKVSLRGIVLMAAISAFLQMVVQPALASALATAFGIGGVQRQVLAVIASLPTAVLGPVFCTRYECEPELSSALVMTHLAVAVVLVPAVFALLNP